MKIVKEPHNSTEATQKIKSGIDKAVNAVKPTLGAVGKTAIIDLGGDFYPIEADDGITVIRNLQFKDRFEQIGLLMLKKRVQMIAEEGGDCTATTSTLIQAVCDEAFKEWKGKKENVSKVITRLNDGLEEVLKLLKQGSIQVKEEDIEKIATVASLDPEIGKIIAEAYKKIGKDGIITVENSPIIGYSSEVVNGARFNQGFISPYFINNPEKLECVLENPVILVVNRKVAANSQLNILQKLIEKGKTNILLIADDVVGEALASLVLNHQKKVINICAVKPYYELERKNEWMQDIATLTGAKVMSEETGVIMEEMDLSFIGSAEKVIVTRKHTTIVNGGGNKEKIDERVISIKNSIAEEVRERNKQILEERLATLTGGVGIIRVGALTDTEVQSKKYKIQNAINVVKGGLEEGIIEGGGYRLAHISNEVNSILKTPILSPIKTMASNAGIYTNFFKRILKKDFVNQVLKKNQGFNFKTKQFENFLETGIIDSTKNTRLAIEAAVSTAKSLINGETIITEEQEE